MKIKTENVPYETYELGREKVRNSAKKFCEIRKSK